MSKAPLAVYVLLPCIGAFTLATSGCGTQLRPELFDASLVISRYCESPHRPRAALPPAVSRAVATIRMGAEREPQRRVRIDDSGDPITLREVRRQARLDAFQGCENVLKRLGGP